MTRDQALKELREIKSNEDGEESHMRADDVLCELLASLGYQDVVDEYEKLIRWFA